MPKSNYHYKTSPLRKCIVSGLLFEKHKLIRFVVSPSKTVVPDINQKLPGRGVWIQAQRQTIDAALTGKCFQRAFYSNVKVEKNLIDIILQQIKKKLCDQISLARKAGKTVSGANQVKTALIKEEFGLLIQASDGSKRETSRFSQSIDDKKIINCLAGKELGTIFSRERVVHCVIFSSAFVENIIFHANLLNNLKNPLPHYNNK